MVDTTDEAGATAPPTSRIICADVIEGLRGLPADSVQCCVTSPPYLGLRSYGIPPRRWDDGTTSCFGDEDTLDRYIQHTVEVFREVRRVLHPTGTVWLNLGDCYAGGGKHTERKEIYNIPDASKPVRPKQKQMHGKNLLMVPHRAAIALQQDGWIIRSSIVWAKGVSFLKQYSGTVMPESTRDRPTWAHEYVFLMTKNPDYFYDIDGCREPYAQSSRDEADGSPYTGRGRKGYAAAGAQNPSDVKRRVLNAISGGAGRNLRTVWVIGKENYPGAHFAVFSTRLVEPIIRLGTPERGVCAQCGEPARRRVVREPVPPDIQAEFDAARAASAAAGGRTDGHTRRRPNYRRRVLREEWEVRCEHARHHGAVGCCVPATVLDPFVGSGRAGIVARRLGRSFIGIDVNPEFADMARRAAGDDAATLATAVATAAPTGGGGYAATATGAVGVAATGCAHLTGADGEGHASPAERAECTAPPAAQHVDLPLRVA